MLGLGSSFFVLSSEYRKSQIDEFYYLKTLLGMTYQEFMVMPIFIRKYLLNKWIEDKSQK